MMQAYAAGLGSCGACSVAPQPQQLLTSSSPSSSSAATSLAVARHHWRLQASLRAPGVTLHQRAQWRGTPLRCQRAAQRSAYGVGSSRQTVVAMARKSNQSQSAKVGAGKAKEADTPVREEARVEASDDAVRNAAASAPFAAVTATTQAPPPPPPQTSTGSPLLWISVGVGLCVAVTRAAGWLKARFMKLAMEQMMKQMGASGGAGSPFGAGGFPPPGGFPSSGGFPPPGAYSPSSNPFSAPFPPPPSSPSKTAAKASPAIDTTVVTPSSSSSKTASSKKSGFVDVEATVAAEPVTASATITTEAPTQEEKKDSKKKFFQDAEVVEEGGNQWSGWSGYSNSSAAANGNGGAGAGTGAGAKSSIGVEQLEKLLENPMIQNMILQYMPEEMRNPETLKWMMQNPLMRKQLEDQLATLSQGEWGSQMGELLDNYDLNNPDIMKQYEDMGMTPEQAVKTIMENPELAQAFQNPKIQAALLDCAKNPMNQMKYVNDQEVMEVFEKISKLFPQAGGP